MTRVDPRRALGEAGERLAVAHLEAAGYEVLERNYRTRYGELDVVAVDGGDLVFCEVKTRVGRSAGIGPLASIGADKRKRIRHMAMQWLIDRAGAPRPATAEIRFDAIGIRLAPDGALVELEHLEDAFA